MKLNKKESPTEDTPVLLQLQRRHTLAEVDQNLDGIKASAHKVTSRSNSISSADTTLNSSQAITEFQTQKSVNNTLSPEGNKTSISTASTVVITESELSSSWLYKNKKAQMNTPSPFESTCDSSTPLAPNQDEQPVEDQSPMIPRPVKPKNGTNPRSKNVTSCFCYTTAVCIICLATLGIMAAIASIIYMEIFSSYNVTSNQTNEETNFTSDREIGIHDLIPMQKIGDLLNNENETIRNDTQTTDLKLSIDTSKLSNSKHIFQKNDVNSSYVELKDVKEESNDSKDIVNEEMKTDEDAILIATNKSSLENESLSETDSVKDTAEGLFQILELTVSKFPNLTDNFSIESQKDESPYSKLFQLYNGLHNTELKNLTMLEEVSVPVIRNVSDSRNLELPNNRSDFNQQTIIKNKFQSLVTENDFDLILKHNSDIETNKTDDLESLLIKSLPRQDQEIEKGKNFKNTDLEQNQTAKFESLLTKSLPHSDQILDKKDKASSLKNNSEHEGKLEDSKQFLVETLSHDQILEKEVGDLALKNKSQIKQDKIDQLEPVLVKSLPHQEENLEPLETTENRKKGHENSRQEQNLKNHTEVPIKPLEQTGNLGNEHEENNTKEHNLDNDTEVSINPFSINQPIVGANVVIPGPVELFKRLMMERETIVKPQVRQDDHDRRFSLAQALDTLRKLDVNNQLPSSRQKPLLRRPSKSQNRNMQHKMQGQEEDSERSHYLENLRKKLYDN